MRVIEDLFHDNKYFLITNIALLQRTLRTTKSNASLVILLDRTAINSIDDRTFQFFENSFKTKRITNKWLIL